MTPDLDPHLGTWVCYLYTDYTCLSCLSVHCTYWWLKFIFETLPGNIPMRWNSQGGTWQHESTLSLWFNLLKGKYKLKSSWTFSFVNNVFRWWLILIYFINKRDFVAVIFLLGMFQKIPSNLMASIIKLNIQMQTSMSLWKYLCRVCPGFICQVYSSMHHQSLYSSRQAWLISRWVSLYEKTFKQFFHC